jgi:PAS domain S-box-containing protein
MLAAYLRPGSAAFSIHPVKPRLTRATWLVWTLAASWAGPALAVCHEPIPSPALRELDARLDDDPAAVAADVARRLATAPTGDASLTVQLYALRADALNLLDDDAGALAAVAAARQGLAAGAQGAGVDGLRLRLALTEADALPAAGRERAADALAGLEAGLAPRSLGRACLLIARSRLQLRLNHFDAATKDGINAYWIATDLHAAGASAEAAYQLAETYHRAGLLEDAARFNDEAVAFGRAGTRAAFLADALLQRAQVLAAAHRADAALSAAVETERLDQRLAALVGIAMARQVRCDVLLGQTDLDGATQACRDTEAAWRASGHPDLIVGAEANLARIDLLRGRPAAALARLNGQIDGGVDRAPSAKLARMHADRAEALAQLGRYREVLRDHQEAARETVEIDAEQRALSASIMQGRLGAERMLEERRVLEAQVETERLRAAASERQLHLSLALAAAAIVLVLLMAVMLRIRSANERAARRAAETRETHARVISTIREGVLLVGDGGTIEFANPSSLRLLGRGAADVVGRGVQEFGISLEQLRGSGEGATGGLPAGAQELYLAERDGGAVWLRLTSAPLVLQARTLLVCVLQDITELRRLEHEVLAAASSERGQLSSEAHEGIAQDLAGIALLLRGLGRGEDDAAVMEFIVAHINHVIGSARALARGLSPVQVAGGSLAVALSRFAADITQAHEIDVGCCCDLGTLSLSAAHSDQLYRIAQECLRIAVRRTNCRRIGVDLRVTPDLLVLTTTSDGGPAPGDAVEEERAWAAIAYRVRIIGGDLRAAPTAGDGTRTVISIPLTQLSASAVAAA